MKIPITDISTASTEDDIWQFLMFLPLCQKNLFEAIFVSTNLKKNGYCDPLTVFIHGGPHTVSLTTFSKSLAFLCAIGYCMLLVNYRGFLGFGEEALQSLPGNIGIQDVNDILGAVDHVIAMGLANPSRITLLGGSHGGFLRHQINLSRLQ